MDRNKRMKFVIFKGRFGVVIRIDRLIIEANSKRKWEISSRQNRNRMLKVWTRNIFFSRLTSLPSFNLNRQKRKISITLKLGSMKCFRKWFDFKFKFESIKFYFPNNKVIKFMYGHKSAISYEEKTLNFITENSLDKIAQLSAFMQCIYRHAL